MPDTPEETDAPTVPVASEDRVERDDVRGGDLAFDAPLSHAPIEATASADPGATVQQDVGGPRATATPAPEPTDPTASSTALADPAAAHTATSGTLEYLPVTGSSTTTGLWLAVSSIALGGAMVRRPRPCLAQRRATANRNA